MIRKIFLLTCLATTLSGCTEGSAPNALDTVDAFGQSSIEPTVGAAQAAIGSAVSNGGDGNNQSLLPTQTVESQQAANSIESLNAVTVAAQSPYVESIETTSAELVSVPESNTSKISTSSDFLFDTARTVQLKVDMADAEGTQGSISICTDFEETTSGYDINYMSCPIRATVSNGQFEHDMALMNQFDSVVAVIWFKNREIAPRYRKLRRRSWWMARKAKAGFGTSASVLHMNKRTVLIQFW